jgi:hypothetical protein
MDGPPIFPNYIHDEVMESRSKHIAINIAKKCKTKMQKPVKSGTLF